MTSFNITMTLLYTGADDVTHLTVRVRHDNDTEWDTITPLTVEPHVASMKQGLKLYGIVTSNSLRSPSELQVEVVNDAGHRSSPLTIHEVLGESRQGGQCMAGVDYSGLWVAGVDYSGLWVAGVDYVGGSETVHFD